MDTKHKVILVVFAVFFAVVVLIYFIGGKSKVEKFEEEEEDVDEEEQFTDSESEDKKPKVSKPQATKKDTETKPKPKKREEDVPQEENKSIDYMKEAMNYLNSMNLPFQIKKEVFSELFSEEGINKLETLTTLPEVKKFVTGVVDMTKSVASPQKTQETQEKFNNSPLLTGLEDVKKQISSLATSLSTVTASIEKLEKDAERETSSKIMPPSKPSTTLLPPSKTTGTNAVIEGFENVRSNYALF
jgi:hypothetical protein